MAKDDLFLVRIYGEKHDGHWALVSLDFGLAAQGKTIQEALDRLDAQIKEYIYDATVGEDKEFGEELLSRKAPVEFFFKYYWFNFRKAIKNHLQNSVACVQPFQLAV